VCLILILCCLCTQRWHDLVNEIIIVLLLKKTAAIFCIVYLCAVRYTAVLYVLAAEIRMLILQALNKI
jgi:hypothetical protein